MSKKEKLSNFFFGKFVIPQLLFMYKLHIAPTEVHQTLGKHILADGFDLTFDLEKSKGVYIYDAKNKKKLLDFFTCFASVPDRKSVV